MSRLKPIHGLVLLAIFFASCRNQEKYPYAIRDFRAGLRPYLTAIVTTGIVGYDSASYFVRQHATDGELLQLSRAECPILRATALRGIAERKSMDNFTVLMSHLDDTATIAFDDGEWGWQFAMLTDDFIHNNTWKTDDEKKKTIDAVIMQHNYLRSAYIILHEIDTLPESYYPFIKKMVLAEKPFEDIEKALFAVARYKKKEDVAFIKQFLQDESHFYRLGSTSFALMRDYPDTSYLPVLTEYYKHHFYRHLSLFNKLYTAVSYVDAISSYKCKKSAEILASIINKKPILRGSVDTFYFKEQLISFVRRDSCPAYSSLIKQMQPMIVEYDKNVGFTINNNTSSDTSGYRLPPEIRW